MERVTFLVEDNNQRLSCMLNPESVMMRRTTGVRPRESLSSLTGSGRGGDNPLLFTGSGSTTLELDLVFDVSIPGSSIETQDVRDLTTPIWNLSENQQRNDGLYRPAICRFIWGKCWNMPGVISAVAERLESFSPDGIPRRSWLRLRLIRMQEQLHSPLQQNELWAPVENQLTNTFMDELNAAGRDVFSTDTQADAVNTAPEFFENSNGRIDLSAYRVTGDCSRWRDLATKFNIVNPLEWLETLAPEPNDSAAAGESQ